MKIFILLTLLSLGIWMLFWSPLASSAAPGSTTAVGISTVTDRLEALHQRALDRLQDQDDDDQPGNTWGHAVSPERAATRAQQLARARGDVTTGLNYIELTTRNGRPVYAVRVATRTVNIDADTGNEAP